MSERKPYGRAGMSWAPGREGPLGYWPSNLNGPGWASQGKSIYTQALQIGQRYHDQNHALNIAAQSKMPPPDLGDVQARHQHAMADMKRLEALVGKMGEIDKQISHKQSG